MNAYMRPWLLLAVLFVITCLTASQKVEKGISGPEDQKYSGSGEAEVPSTCSNGTCSGNGRCTVETHGDRSVAVCVCHNGVVGRWCDDISQRSYPTYCGPNLCRSGEICKVNVDGYGFVCETPSSGCSACRPEDCQIIGGIAMCQPSNQHCEPNPCRNGGTCNDPTGNGFVCRCRDGYSGTRCKIPPAIGCTPTTCGVHGDCVLSKCRCHSGWQGELCDVAPCTPNPCLSGGACRIGPGGNGFVCQCRTGFSGTRCEIRPAIGCTPATCGVHGDCVLLKCRCHSGWQGEQCDVAPCIPNPCIHGTCTTVNRSFKCRCHQGYHGILCRDRSNDRCNPNPCAKGGICTLSTGGYSCTCHHGYTGVNCGTAPPLRGCNTYPYPCHNGGLCIPIGSTRFQCECRPSFSGPSCDVGPGVTSLCLPVSPCQNGGTCNEFGRPICQCLDGYSGLYCQIPPPITPCSPNPCLNGGTCTTKGHNRFQCECGRYFSGPRCDVGHGGTSLCLPVNPCQNGGTCNEFGRTICQCLDGYSGLYCQILPPITPCSPNPCLNGGTCTTRGQSFECQCSHGYGGTRCGHHSNDNCNPNPCANGEICTSSTAGHVCTCPRGYSGGKCNTVPPPDSCKPNPCLNGGRCTPFGSAALCRCIDGYIGQYCAIQPDPCLPNPCRNGGTCGRSLSNERLVDCSCPDGYTGSYCTERNNPCLPNPCRNGGTCGRLFEQSRPYSCDCLPGTGPVGEHCELIERSQDSPCNPNPCHGGCKCVASCRHANGYYCRGTNGLLGRNCQIPAPVIVCGENTISVSIDAEVVNEYDAGVGQFTMFMSLSHSMISATTCPAQNQGNSYTLVLPLPFNNCGTVVVTNADGKTVISNYIWLNRLIANGVADMPVPILHFTCEYEKQYSVISSLNPGIDIPPTIVSHGKGKRTDSAVMDLCKSGKFCPSQCPAMYSLSRGATYTVGEDLFLRITPTNVGTQFRISDLFLSCSSDPATTYGSSPIVLLASGCLATGSGKYLPTNVRPLTSGVCASFPVPLLRSCGKFFIHAKLQSCSPGVCVGAYTPCSRRRRRSDQTSEESENKIQVFGPIVVIEGKAGVATKVMYPDEEHLNSTNTGVLVFKAEAVPTITSSNIFLPLYVSLGVLLLLAVSVIGLLVGHNWHKINAHCGRKV